MKYTLKDYANEKNDVIGKYLEYYDEKSGKRFTNAEYFIIDIVCDDFKDIMSHTGGFVANMTTRMIEKMDLPCESIMLCQTPQENNTFLFQFVYLGKNKEVLNVEWDNNYFDYEYFKKKFSDCIIEQSCIFDLLKCDYFKEITNEFKTPTEHFGIKVDGKEIDPDDVIICEDLCFLKDDYIEQMRGYGVTHAELKLTFDPLNSTHFNAELLKEDGSSLPKYQALLDCKTIEEFREEYSQRDEDFYSEPYKIAISLPIMRRLADHFTLKEKELEEDLEL